MLGFSGTHLPRAYEEALWFMRAAAREENSRNGPVLSVPEPVQFLLRDPTRRVLYDPIRDANPFFHVMETVWMFAGSDDVTFIEQFNKRYRQYAEPHTDIIHGAYGARWRQAFDRDQILDVIDLLRRDPTTRRAVMGMWNPKYDLDPHNDLPCNTHIYFRVVDGCLDMTVCNRSNDLIWGMLGANVVHMTYLQELVAAGAGCKIGKYRVLTNNLHIYKEMPRFKEIWHARGVHNRSANPMPLFPAGEKVDVEVFLRDCEWFIRGDEHYLAGTWIREVASPMRSAYLDKPNRTPHISEIRADDWRIACEEWSRRRERETDNSK